MVIIKILIFGANFTYQIGGKVYNVATMSQLSGGKETGLGLNKYKDLAGAFQLYVYRMEIWYR